MEENYQILMRTSLLKLLLRLNIDIFFFLMIAPKACLHRLGFLPFPILALGVKKLRKQCIKK